MIKKERIISFLTCNPEIKNCIFFIVTNSTYNGKRRSDFGRTRMATIAEASFFTKEKVVVQSDAKLVGSCWFMVENFVVKFNL